MNLSSFTNSLLESTPPVTSIYLQALWYDKKDNWKAAHELVDGLGDKKSFWIHAYLHRKEGDASNAEYWYAKAGRKKPTLSLNEEWEQLVEIFLNEDSF